MQDAKEQLAAIGAEKLGGNLQQLQVRMSWIFQV